MLARCRSVPQLGRLFSTATTQSLSDAARIQLQGGNPPVHSLIDMTTLSPPTLAELASLPSHSFTVYPRFLSSEEQNVLLKSALTKLGVKRRRKTRGPPSVPSGRSADAYPLQHLFGEDSQYDFEEGHFDGVIRDYREITVSSWPVTSPAGLADILLRLYKLVDPLNTPAAPGIDTPHNVQTHVLHLASTGFILPHVDNVEASGSMIAGVSLGDTRVLRLSRDREAFDVLLETGSVYIQRDNVRYGWKHEIPIVATFQGEAVGNGGQRLSVMLRDKYMHKS